MDSPSVVGGLQDEGLVKRVIVKVVRGLLGKGFRQNAEGRFDLATARQGNLHINQQGELYALFDSTMALSAGSPFHVGMNLDGETLFQNKQGRVASRLSTSDAEMLRQAVSTVADPELRAIATLTSAADKGIQFTGNGTAATYDLTAAGKALLDDIDPAAQRATLGLGTGATAIAPLVAYKTADESVSNTTLQDDDHLTVTVLAGGKYAIRALVFADNAGALEGLKLALGGTCTATSLKAQMSIYDDVTNALVAFARVTALTSSVGAGLSLGGSLSTITGTIEVNAGGTLLLSWAQNAGAGASATTIQRGSYMIVERLA